MSPACRQNAPVSVTNQVAAIPSTTTGEKTPSKKRIRSAKSIELELQAKSRRKQLADFVESSTFVLGFAIAILVNVSVMAAEAQYKGVRLGKDINFWEELPSGYLMLRPELAVAFTGLDLVSGLFYY